ncbi:rhodanese domain protein [Natrialba magadii ATCC 43099]|uniref:Rhodanese n=1 Tax=Natrialba magadii (strain ATCC 43099 / DSM 3394 / CCM 3739 / CIP 104546 / IAM 13178 / JCM 8861 / NBRC 102185 / NCIMB 2190 / MS3) TaxID=547559 RepID=D3SUA8_NATMM|nr:rhodanese-like domain-containing protein [Natrialba magadii]ADD05166.1 rhodanese domain protein [Natrialba magadii ATCC 43099]ELY23204.1 rhodanese [Natrialba magadii ATCC 43099]
MDGEISPDEVKELLESDADVRIVDIRDQHSFNHSRIPGSENVPFQKLTSRVEEFEDASRIVTVCPHGKASIQAAQLLGSYEGTADARIESMEGGLEKYGLKFGLVAGDREAESGAADGEHSADAGAGSESPF